LGSPDVAKNFNEAGKKLIVAQDFKDDLAAEERERMGEMAVQILQVVEVFWNGMWG